MRYFDVTVLIKGKKEIVKIKAESRQDAISIAKNRVVGIPLRAIEGNPSLMNLYDEHIGNIKNKIIPKKNIKIETIIGAMRQLAVMTGAGISIHQSIQNIIDMTNEKDFKEIMQTAYDGINSGKSLSEALLPYKKELGNLTISMIDLGEKTGNLPESLAMLTKTLEDLKENRDKFKKALRYPLITLTAMAIAFVILILLVVPKFKAIFASFKAELPMPTKVLLAIEHALSNYGLLILGFFVALYFAFKYMYGANENFKNSVDRYTLKLYLIGDIIYLSSLNLFMISISQLAKAGIPLTDALNSGISMVDNKYLRDKLSLISASIQKGGDLTTGFKDSELFENMIIQMVHAGEISGSLDELLGKGAQYYKMRFDNILDNISSYIEPLMLAFIAGLVLLLALGIFLPMWDLSSAVKK